MGPILGASLTRTRRAPVPIASRIILRSGRRAATVRLRRRRMPAYVMSRLHLRRTRAPGDDLAAWTIGDVGSLIPAVAISIGPPGHGADSSGLPKCFGRFATIVATSGNDNRLGGGSSDTAGGGTGDDHLDGGRQQQQRWRGRHRIRCMNPDSTSGAANCKR